jgi:hypothetical protein
VFERHDYCFYPGLVTSDRQAPTSVGQVLTVIISCDSAFGWRTGHRFRQVYARSRIALKIVVEIPLEVLRTCSSAHFFAKDLCRYTFDLVELNVTFHSPGIFSFGRHAAMAICRNLRKLGNLPINGTLRRKEYFCLLKSVDVVAFILRRNSWGLFCIADVLTTGNVVV